MFRERKRLVSCTELEMIKGKANVKRGERTELEDQGYVTEK